MEFLSQKGIEYGERDVTQNPDWLDELVGSGYTATPMTMIDGKAIVGFDPNKLNGALGT